jgi:glycosyltransferase involved in cell wall biosynthesis
MEAPLISAQNKPLISIITPSFNQGKFLESTVRSVLAQDYPNIEYILIDGGSTDNSLEILQKYQDHFAYWESVPDQGQAHAINKGFQRATGEFIAWLNSDDLYMAGAISQAVKALQRNPDAGMVFGDGVVIDAENRLLDLHRYKDYTAFDLLCFDVLLQPATFMRRSVLEKVGLLREDYHLIMDHELWIRIASLVPIQHVSQFWAAERTYPEAKTMDQAGNFVSEAERLLQELDDFVGEQAFDRVKLHANLKTFAGRRYIDAKEYRNSLKAFLAGMRIKPGIVFKYWYKVVQAIIGFLGLEQTFLVYRSIRRWAQYRMRVVEIGESGAHIIKQIE